MNKNQICYTNVYIKVVTRQKWIYNVVTLSLSRCKKMSLVNDGLELECMGMGYMKQSKRKTTSADMFSSFTQGEALYRIPPHPFTPPPPSLNPRVNFTPGEGEEEEEVSIKG